MKKLRINCFVDEDTFNDAKEIMEKKADIPLTTTQIIRRCLDFFVKERNTILTA